MSKKIRSLERGLLVVESLNKTLKPLNLQQLHDITKLDKATLLRVLVTLEESGWVYRNMGDKCYRLTYQIHELGEHIQSHDALVQIAAPVLAELQQEVVWPSDLAIYNGDCMEIVETSRRRSPMVINREIMGFEADMLLSAMGRAYLAWSSEEERKKIVDRLRRIKTEGSARYDAISFARELDLVLERGYAVREEGLWGGVLDSEFEEVSAIAVPIIVMGEVQACVNLVWLNSLSQPGDIESVFYPKLAYAADKIAGLLKANQMY
ncbi:MAG: helix-turn-helix domain-containing protein [Oceanospirillales bacterium]|nr:helix-turn-helix domain-containing protein [Oceanospirillales bacterium]MBR9886068.1 helix-turn-helix domain-containing protein [Oceanospirillales bacterium]